MDCDPKKQMKYQDLSTATCKNQANQNAHSFFDRTFNY